MGGQTVPQKACENNSGDGGEKRDTINFVDYQDESQLEYVDKLVTCDLSEPYSIFTYRFFLHRFPDLCILAVDSASGEVCGCVVGKIDEEEYIDRLNVAAVDVPSEDADKYNNTHERCEDKANEGISINSKTDNSACTTQQDLTERTEENNSGRVISPAIMKTTESMVQTGYIGMLAVRKSYRRKGIGKDLVRQVLKRMKERGCTSATLETEVSNVTAQKLYQNHFGFIREELLVRYYLNCGDAYRLRLWF